MKAPWFPHLHVPRVLRSLVGLSVLLALTAGGAARAVADDDDRDRDGDRRCRISGPTSVGAFETFTLCASGTDSRYRWEGPGVNGKHGSCVTIHGLPPGTYDFRLVRSSGREDDDKGKDKKDKKDKKGKRDRDALLHSDRGAACTFRVVVRNGSSGECLISGPSSVPSGSSFTLCGPSGSGFTYSWEGSGVPSGSFDRCVTIPGRSSGDYDYKLVVKTPSGERTCTWRVHVNGAGTGACTITGPSSVSAGTSFTLCGPSGTGFTYAWEGSGVPLGSTDRCVTVSGRSSGNYDYRLVVKTPSGERTCTWRVHVNGATGTCSISGPTSVATGQSFTLCGPSGTGYEYEWEGPGVPSGSIDRCVTISGRSGGFYDYRLLLKTPTGDQSCTIRVHANGATGACTISGPTSVATGQSFTLCGPSGTGYKYVWEGSGVPFGSTDRCVTVSGRSSGLYDYKLVIKTPTGELSCSIRVDVNGTGGSADACPGSAHFWKRQCSNGSKSILSDEDFEELARRIDSGSDFISWSDDVGGLCSVLRSNGRGSGSAHALKHQYVVLLANVHAAEMGLRNERGRLIGVDGDIRVSCSGISASSVWDLIDDLDRALNKNDVTSRSIERMTRCLEELNLGSRACRAGYKDDDDDDDDDDSTFPSEAASALASEGSIALGRPTPNPFEFSTRIRYAVPVETDVEIAVFDLAGRQVKSLAQGRWSAGSHEVRWDGTDARGSAVRPGMYFLRGRLGDERVTARLMFVK